MGSQIRNVEEKDCPIKVILRLHMLSECHGTSTWGLSVAPLSLSPSLASPSPPSHLLHRAVMEDMTGPP